MCELMITNPVVGFQFWDVYPLDAARAAKELGATKEAHFILRGDLFSISYLNDDNMEIAYYSVPMDALRIHAAPRGISGALHKYRIEDLIC